MFRRHVVASLVLASLCVASHPSHACRYPHPMYVYPQSDPGPRMVSLPSDPTLYLLVRDDVRVHLDSDGTPVPYRIVPTDDPRLERIEVQLANGPLHVQTDSTNLYGHRNYYYSVSPGVVIRKRERWMSAELLGGDLPGMFVHVESDAALYRVEWSDGQIGDLPADEVVLPVAAKRGLSFRIVGLFTDGTQATLFESSHAGAEHRPVGLLRPDHVLLWALAAVWCVLLWLAQPRGTAASAS